MQKINYLLMTRCSTIEQKRKGNSHPTQERIIKTNWRVEAWNCLGTFSETVTSWKAEAKRGKLDEVYDFCKENKGVIQYVLFQKCDRFYRNTGKAWEYVNKFKKINVEINFIETWIEFAAPNSHLMLNIYLGQAEEESRNTSMRTKQNIQTIKLSGFYIGSRAPCGYEKVKIGERGSLQDDQTGKLGIIKKLFDYYLEGVGARMAFYESYHNLLGIGKTQFYRLFQCHVYTGHNLINGEYVEGKWKGIISVDQFQVMQRLIADENGKGVRKGYKNFKMFWLKNCLYCAETGKRMTASSSKGKTRHYHYYHPQYNKGQRIKAEVGHDLVNKAISCLRLIDNDYIRQVIKQKLKERLTNTKVVDTKIANLHKKIKDSDEKLKRIKNYLASGDLDPNDFREMKQDENKRRVDYHQQIQDLLHKKKNSNFDISNIEESLLSEFKNFVNRDSLQKNRLLSILFPDGFSISQGKLKGRINVIIQNFLSKKSMALLDCAAYSTPDGSYIELIQKDLLVLKKLIA